MKELRSVDNPTDAAVQDSPGIIVVVFEIGWPIVWVEEPKTFQRCRTYHEAIKIGAVGEL